jgi:hypothetical protein
VVLVSEGQLLVCVVAFATTHLANATGVNLFVVVPVAAIAVLAFLAARR